MRHEKVSLFATTRDATVCMVILGASAASSIFIITEIVKGVISLAHLL